MIIHSSFFSTMCVCRLIIKQILFYVSSIIEISQIVLNLKTDFKNGLHCQYAVVSTILFLNIEKLAISIFIYCLIYFYANIFLREFLCYLCLSKAHLIIPEFAFFELHRTLSETDLKVLCNKRIVI